jgi:hypothetical protein
METPTYKITVGEKKFRAMVEDLMVMKDPRMNIQAPNQSKARSLRRSFYTWRENLAGYERKFLQDFEFKVIGRLLVVSKKANWQPEEVQGESSVSNSQGESA